MGLERRGSAARSRLPPQKNRWSCLRLPGSGDRLAVLVEREGDDVSRRIPIEIDLRIDDLVKEAVFRQRVDGNGGLSAQPDVESVTAQRDVERSDVRRVRAGIL